MIRARVFPLRDASLDELAELAGGEVARATLVEGGIVNTIREVARADGQRVAVKHFATRERFETELALLERLRGAVPVPAVARVDHERCAIAYAWLDGVSLSECRRTDPPAFAALAGAVGDVAARIARCAPPAGRVADTDELHARLAAAIACGRLASPLAESLERAFDALPWRALGEPAALVHGDFGGRNLLVDPAAHRVIAVLDWEYATASWPLCDVGSFFRYRKRFDDAYREAFARSYRAAGGELTDGWQGLARVLDAGMLLGYLLEGDDERPYFDEVRDLLARVVAAVG